VSVRPRSPHFGRTVTISVGLSSQVSWPVLATPPRRPPPARSLARGVRLGRAHSGVQVSRLVLVAPTRARRLPVASLAPTATRLLHAQITRRSQGPQGRDETRGGPTRALATRTCPLGGSQVHNRCTVAFRSTAQRPAGRRARDTLPAVHPPRRRPGRDRPRPGGEQQEKLAAEKEASAALDRLLHHAHQRVRQCGGVVITLLSQVADATWVVTRKVFLSN
jgi:hypothetical protein